VNLHELRAFTLVALLGGLSFWPAACFSIRASVEESSILPKSPDALGRMSSSVQARREPRPSAAEIAALTPRESQALGLAGLTPEKDPGLARSSSLSILSGRDGWAVMASAQGKPIDVIPFSKPSAGSGTTIPALRTLATNAADLCGVPAALFHSLIERESSWRPSVVSRSGAVGLAQVKPSTAREVSPTLDVSDPWQNLVAGACYLRRQFDRFGTWRAALHAYRLGPSAVVTRTAREYASDIMGGAQ